MKTKPVKREMRTPISYYGGKQRMVPAILPKIPKHHTYVEPFFGGGAVFWAKPPSQAEVVNDINHRLVTFYKVLKYDFEDLASRVDETFHSRAQHRESDELYLSQQEEITQPVACAWSVWVQTNMSFGTMIGGGFGYDRGGKCALKIANKKAALTSAFQDRLRRVTIECYDVLKVIRAYDAPDAFFYLDPPYVTSNQGHYGGYTMDDFRALLDACATMQGTSLLSSYPEEILMEYRDRYGWKSEDHVKALCVDGRRKEAKTKTECLTWNY
ncbi:DNA adenine methylase [Rhabdobacter roseus]|uniref:DNA adenine methylase n=1 Tax=Rhabdobacter roseus TaxID=1655419 RepID=A0A840U008_9BACT|nr:DNA adenine methylase [Rhabdobacter roseus]MBB5287117.1 DNA adenine methylase [Rhabdobacter roseus]